MNHIIDSCRLMGQELDNNKKIFTFDVENGGGFLSLQWDKPLDHDDNLFIADKIAGSVITETNFYKNKIHPIASNIIEKLNKYIEDSKIQTTGAENFSISMVNMPEELDDLLKHNDMKFDYKVSMELVDLNTDFLKPIYKDSIEIKDGALNRLAKKLFHSGDFTNESIDKLYSFINEPLNKTFTNIEEMEYIIKAFLYSKMMEEEYPIYVTPSKKLSIAIKGLKEKYDYYINTNVIILTCKKINEETIIYLLEENFNKIPETGDLVEAIFGLSLHPNINSDFLLTLSENIIANKEEYIKRWNTFLEAKKYEDPYVKQSKLRNLFNLVFQEEINNMDEELLFYTKISSTEKDRLKIIISEYLKSIEIKEDLDNVAKCVYAIMGDLIFVKTNYTIFINDCMEFLNKNQKLTMEDIVILVNAKFIVKYLLGKTKIFDIK